MQKGTNNQNERQIEPSNLESFDLDSLLAQRRELLMQEILLGRELEPLKAALGQGETLGRAVRETFGKNPTTVDEIAEAKWQSLLDRVHPHIQPDNQAAFLSTFGQYRQVCQQSVAIEQVALAPAVRRLDKWQQRLVFCVDWEAVLMDEISSPEDQWRTTELKDVLIALSKSVQAIEPTEFIDVLNDLYSLDHYYEKAVAKSFVNEDKATRYEQLPANMRIVTEPHRVGLRPHSKSPKTFSVIMQQMPEPPSAGSC